MPHNRRTSTLVQLIGRGRTDSAAYRLAQAPLRPPREVAWGRKQPLGGVLASAPTAAEDSSGHMQVFGLGPDGTVWHRTLVSTDAASKLRSSQPSTQVVLSPWGSLGGDFVTVPLAAIRASGAVSVLAGGSDGMLYLKSQDAQGAAWDNWRSVGGPIRVFAC